MVKGLLPLTVLSRSYETPTPLGSPEVPRHRATVGSYKGGVSYERGTPAHSLTLTLVSRFGVRGKELHPNPKPLNPGIEYKIVKSTPRGGGGDGAHARASLTHLLIHTHARVLSFYPSKPHPHLDSTLPNICRLTIHVDTYCPTYTLTHILPDIS